MSASNQIVKLDYNKPYIVQPVNFAELERYANMLAKSSFCPKPFLNKPGDVVAAIQMGAEVGLSAMQAIQNIAVINGKPTMYGDALLAVVQGHPSYEYHHEEMKGTIEAGTREAICTVKRRGQPIFTVVFSMADAKKAQLWSKPGVWQQYPDRMLQMRARGFALRDKFADALRGIYPREEVEDYQPMKDVTPANEAMHKQAAENQKQLTQQIEQDELSLKFMEFLSYIKIASDEESLKAVFDEIKKSNFKSKPDLLKKLIDAKDKRKGEILMAAAIPVEAELNTMAEEVTQGVSE